MEANLQERVARAARHLVDLGATEVHVFGSAVSGRLRDDSDVDLAVRGLPSSIFFRAVSEATRIVGRPVDLLDLDRGDGIAKSIAESGELIRVV